MDPVTTPVKSGTDTATGSISRLELLASAEMIPQGDNIVFSADGPSTASRSEIDSTPSTGSSNTSRSSLFSSQSNGSFSNGGTPSTPPSEYVWPKGRNIMNCEANPKGKDSEQSVGEILQNEKLQGSRGAVQRHSAPQPDEDVVEFGFGGSGGLVYGYKFDFVAALGHKSKTPKNVSGQDLNTEGEQHSAKPGEADVTSNDSETHTETEDNRLEDSRSLKKARRDGASLSPTRSLSEDAQLHLANGPPVMPIAIPTARPLSRDSSPSRSATPCPKATLETTASLITSSPEVEVIGSLFNNVAAPSHSSGKRKPRKAKGLTPEGERRRSSRIRQLNQDKANASATTHADVEQSCFAHYVTEEESSQNSGEEVCDSDEHEAITDEYQASTTSGHAPGSVAREPKSDTKAAEVVQPPINDPERPDMDTTKRAGSIIFEQYEEIKSPTDIKIAILNVILPEEKKHILDKEGGFVYMYRLDSSEGHVKIGKSKQKHGLRVKQWANSCKLPFERISDPDDKRFLHYGIVEKLVHTELSNRRKKHVCGTCKKNGGKKQEKAKADHAEWFEVKEPHALEVVERWRGWLVRHQPYGKDGTLRGIWIWKHRKLSEATTDDFKEWPILIWSDWAEYVWYRVDNYLDEELPTMLRSSLFINAVLVFVTRLWCVSNAFPSSIFTIVILAMFFKYS